MAAEETLDQNNQATGAPAQAESQDTTENSETQGEERRYTQQEVDDMMARVRKSTEQKVLKPYKDLGDPEELRQIKEEYEQQKQSEQIDRGEFEKTLQDLASKKDSEIQKRDEIIKDFKLNQPLLNAAAKNNSVDPEQVQSLLQDKLTLDEDGEAVAVDKSGSIQYNDKGEAKGVDELVQEFLTENPHFVKPSASTSNTNSNSGVEVKEDVDVSQLDMKNPEHRKMYARIRNKK